MHMIDVLDKLKEIQENYDNEDIQRAIATAAKMNPVEEEVVAERGHDCAKHFEHKKFGKGTVIHGEHTLSEDGTEVSHYDAKFVKEDGSTFTVRNIPVANMTITEKHRHNHKKNIEKCGQFDEEVVDEGFVDPDLQDILDAHEEEYQAFRGGGEVASDLNSEGEFYSDLYDYFVNSGEMPYGTAKARTGDPLEWIANYLDHMDDPYAVGETVEEVHEEENNDLEDIIKLAGRKSVLGLNQNVTIAESTELSEEDELEEAQSPAQKAAFEKMLAAKNGDVVEEEVDEDEDKVEEAAKPDFLDIDDDGDKEESMKKAAKDKEDEEDEDPVKEGLSIVPRTPMTKKLKPTPTPKPKQKTIDVMSGYDGESDNESIKEEGIEETVEVPLSELADLLRLAGYENYEEKLSEYENDPEEKYFDVEDQLIGLAGGLNRPKTMYPTVAGGDNPMAVIPVKVDEADMFEKIYQNYQNFTEEAKQEQTSDNK